MKILGIDPGSRSAGYGLIKVSGNKFNYIDSGTLKYNVNADFIERLGDIYESCLEVCHKHTPDSIAIESLIYVKSPTALMKLAQARGAMIAAFSKNFKSNIFEYSPNLIKATVTGHGHATKEAIQKTLAMILKVQGFRSHDESDAVAIAICHGILSKSKLIEKNISQ